MGTYYVEDYDGERNEDAIEAVVLAPVVDDAPVEEGVQAKVVEAPEPKPAKKTAAKKVTTKAKG